MKFLVILFFCLTVLFGKVYSQNFTRYGFLEGLENENIVHINQDKKGNLWVATLGGGVSMFNGLEFRNYTVRKGLAHNFVMNVFCGPSEIYAINDLGISVLRGGKFTSNYHHQVVTSALLDESVFFKNENGKLGELRNEIIYSIPFPEDSEVVQAITAFNDELLVLSKSKILYGLDDNKKLVVLHNFNNEAQFNYNGNAIWIGKGLDYLKHTIIISNVSLAPQFDKLKIQQVLVESPLRCWFIYDGKLFLKSDSKLTQLSKKDGFTDGEVNYLFKDLEDNIWVASSDGLYKIHFSKFNFVASSDLDDKISTITSGRSGQILVGTQKGKLLQVQNGIVTPSNLLKPYIVSSYSSSFFDSVTNSTWLGTGENGLFRISDNGKAERVGKNEILFEGEIRNINGSRGNIWIGTQRGLIRVDENDSLKIYQASSGLSDNISWGIQETEPGTVVNLTRKGVDFITNETVRTDTSLQKLATKRVTCFIKDALGNFWVGTLGFGLLYINRESESISELTSDDGLNSDVIVNLVQIRGQVYVGTFKGIDVVTLTENNEPIVRHLSNEITPTNFNSFYFEAKSNKLWFGSNEKCFSYKLEDGNSHAPLVSLQKSIITGSSGEVSLENVPDEMGTLSYRENNVKFEFLGLNLTNPQEVTYSTRLIGWDSIWTKPVKSRVASFTNLPPGKYKFEVVAYNHDGVKSATSSFVNFSISKPLWLETWFITSMVILLTAFSIIVNRYRINRKMTMAIELERSKQEVLERVRKNIARDFHDNMGNKLAGIKLYTNLVGLKLKDVNSEVSELLKYIEKNSQELFEGTKDFIWSIDPESDNLIEVYAYIKDFGEEFFKRTDIAFYSDMISGNELTKIPSGWSRQIVLIFKEAMTNTIKHSEGSSARFQMEVRGNVFVFKYSDNGKGLNGFHSQGKGLINMKARAEGISCDLLIGKSNENEFEIKLSGKFS